MLDRNYRLELREQLNIFLYWVLSGLLDGCFLILWVLTQWATNQVISSIHLSNVDNVMLSIFSVVFGLTTLAPVLFYVIQDVVKMYSRTRRAIKEEWSSQHNGLQGNLGFPSQQQSSDADEFSLTANGSPNDEQKTLKKGKL